jgi:CRP/FNR family transcriptional regulator, cyclic AMP receptor protein
MRSRTERSSRNTRCRYGHPTATRHDRVLPRRIRQTDATHVEKGHRKAMRTSDELLARVPLFGGLSKRDLREISGLTTRLDLPEGRELTHQGGRGNEFVIVLEGTVDVVIDGKVVATCGAGDFFGEIALLEDRPRTATVIAKTHVVVDVIGRGEFSVLLDHHPQIDEQLRAAMARRLTEDEALPGGAPSDP